MMAIKQYPSASGFRNALEERLNRMAKERGIDLMRIRRKVAFDRFLFRLLQHQYEGLVVKGGYALELRFDQARATKDIDLSVRNVFLSRVKSGDTIRSEQIRRMMQDALGIPGEDYFEFTIGQAVMDLENAPDGGCRFPIQARLAGRLFVKFDVDVAFGDVWLTPHEMVKAPDWLAFAGIDPPEIPLISKEQQFAEKFHAYTLSRERMNSRVKDLVDLVLILEKGALDVERMKTALHGTFERRATHPLPRMVSDPPELWSKPFTAMMTELGLPLSMQEGVDKVRKYLRFIGF